ncbi:alkaline phosphatase family protein [Haladaptatus pallidirubidus]|uniref:Alkaline phosphatase family protein n=1 Tax=Haladaptatus pallidirubidus TaxID=1008152 RepID=A0AAV3URD3_9EURY|nr:alkaline phosphatase family protein [Haladaptatus pallidirubidus]
MTKTIVVGLDGAGFELLTPWIEEGELPTLQRIVDQGITGDLESVLPPVTSPNWKAYATGKNPGKLGIYWWYNIDTANQDVYLPAKRYHDHAEYWDQLAEQERVVVLGVPTTYPPKSVGKAYISGAPDADTTGFTAPSELEDELQDRFDYQVTTRRSLESERAAAYEEILDRIDTQFQVGKYLLDSRDLSYLQLTTFYINVLHHHFWDDERTLRAWKMIDDHLESFLDSDTNLILMSDHGHAEIQTVFYINRWLEQEGYLSFDTHVSSTLHQAGVTADRINKALEEVDPHIPFDPQSVAAEIVPDDLINRLPNDEGNVGRGKLDTANWEETTAIASAQGPLYLNVDVPRYESVRGELIDKLKRLQTPDGKPIAREVYRGEDVYNGPYADEWPDIVVDKAPSIHISDTVGGAEIFTRNHDTWCGVNTRSGLFAATGPLFTTGTIDDISILDLAPTLLHAHDCSVPSDMDGRIRSSIFAADTTTGRTK